MPARSLTNGISTSFLSIYLLIKDSFFSYFHFLSFYILIKKVTGCLYVCISQRISLTAEPIWFSFTIQLLIGLGMVYNYFEGGYHHPPQRNQPFKKYYHYHHFFIRSEWIGAVTPGPQLFKILVFISFNFFFNIFPSNNKSKVFFIR